MNAISLTLSEAGYVIGQSTGTPNRTEPCMLEEPRPAIVDLVETIIEWCPVHEDNSSGTRGMETELITHRRKLLADHAARVIAGANSNRSPAAWPA
jgi:hypothetical protein